MPRDNKRAAALRERLAQEPDMVREPPIEYPMADESRTARAHFLGKTVLDRLTSGRVVEQLPVATIAPELRPELRQPRRLPLPEELRSDEGWLHEEAVLIEELLTLGRSLVQRQIQPIVVYPGASLIYPQARYLIAVGHRRWTAAVLVGKETLDAIVIEPPSPEDLIDLQYTENEKRAEFCDMERAWALERMKQRLGDAPWEVVEQRFGLSEARRKQLMRLTVFAPEQQQLLAYVRAAETQIRPLHTALRDGSLSADQGTTIVNEIVDQVRRTVQAHARRRDTGTGAEGDVGADRSYQLPVAASIGKAQVTQLVEQAKRAAAPDEPSPRPRWLMPLLESVQRTHTGLQRARPRLDELDGAMVQELVVALGGLTTEVARIVDEMRGESRTG
ncbi:MAG: ParB/RepB/Spo0J family partition protein [Chloroflexaceae bacterium]|nr:ParB/RepB/Spo0J family partition protein [Chloroflexaceae bacterium]